MNSKKEDMAVKNNSIDSVFTIPNIISFVRIFLIIPFTIYFVTEEYIIAFAVILVSGVSDCLDGFLARKLNQVTELGKLLDPLADKLTLVSVLICLGILIPKLLPMVIILVLKDVLMLAGGLYLLKQGIIPPPAKWYGKVATIVFYISVVIIVFLKGFLEYEVYMLTFILLSITFVAMMFALIKYAIIFKALLENKGNNISKQSKGIEDI
ncbi:MAG: CDP-alcohol phosphatidyltransferase family protein [Acutalibacteraceae bacterium]|nr:CDP-alcohol phosphatidyltransferase family protein [Acutalibacteraceae bacterium]